MVGAAMPRPMPLRSGSLAGARTAANSASTAVCRSVVRGVAVALRVVARGADRGNLGADDGLQRARYAEPAESLRVVHPGQARVEPGVKEVLLRYLLWIVLREEHTHSLAEHFRCNQHGVI